MKSFYLIITLISITVFAFSSEAMLAYAQTSGAYFKPNLKTGEQFKTVFSRTISIKGSGFKEHVERVSGTAKYTVIDVTPDTTTFNLHYRYDGSPGGQTKIKLLSDDITYCHNGKCQADRQTSGLVFNPLLWGDAPAKIQTGTNWTVKIKKPWELGPPGTEQVQVVRADPVNHVITLIRDGSGSYSSLSNHHNRTISITTDAGKTIKVTVIPGKTRWHGYTTVCNGIIIGDEIMVNRDVTLVTKSGKNSRAWNVLTHC